MVLLAVGVRPNIKLAQEAGLAIGPSGYWPEISLVKLNKPRHFLQYICRLVWNYLK